MDRKQLWAMYYRTVFHAYMVHGIPGTPKSIAKIADEMLKEHESRFPKDPFETRKDQTPIPWIIDEE